MGAAARGRGSGQVHWDAWTTPARLLRNPGRSYCAVLLSAIPGMRVPG
jgi:hypothetical protein